MHLPDELVGGMVRDLRQVESFEMEMRRERTEVARPPQHRQFCSAVAEDHENDRGETAGVLFFAFRAHGPPEDHSPSRARHQHFSALVCLIMSITEMPL